MVHTFLALLRNKASKTLKWKNYVGRRHLRGRHAQIEESYKARNCKKRKAEKHETQVQAKEIFH